MPRSCNWTTLAKPRSIKISKWGMDVSHTSKTAATDFKSVRRIVTQFRSGSHWLNLETARHQGTKRENRTCPLCNFRVVNLDLDVAQFDSFDSDDDATDPIEDEYHAFLLTLAMCMPDN